MNMLNSIILEGSVTKAGLLDNHTGKMQFDICVSREYKNAAGETVIERPVFTVVVKGKLAEYSSDKRRMYEGRGVRIVGRLVIDDDKTKILAEHIEYKPS